MGKDDYYISADRIKKAVIRPPSRLIINKKLLNSILYSHFYNVGWFSWTEIESVEMNDSDVYIKYKESDS